MNAKLLISAVLIFSLATMACGISINLPVTQVKTGPTQTEDISIPWPSAEGTPDLTIKFGAGTLTVNPGDESALVAGTATYNVPDLKPEITTNGNEVELSSGDLEIQGIPKFDSGFKNDWNLRIGTLPMTLYLEAGAYKGNIDLGGLALEELTVQEGASDTSLNFSSPNPAQMRTFRYDTGASNVTLSGLGNANFQTMIFHGGAGNFKLDFSGQQTQNANVDINAGLSNVEITVPATSNVHVVVTGGLKNVTTSGAWQQSNNEYQVNGTGPQLQMQIEIGAGKLELQTS